MSTKGGPNSRHSRRDPKEALQPIASSSSDNGSFTSVVSKAIMAPFNHVQRQSDSSRILTDLAPVIMTPRMITATASSSQRSLNHGSNTILAPIGLRNLDFASLGRAPMRLSLGSRRVTSRHLEIVEATDQLLSAEIPEPDGVASDVSLLRGFNATIPSSERGKSRRRKTRNVAAPYMGLRKLGLSARGMLGSDDDDNMSRGSGDEFNSGQQTLKGRQKPLESLATSVVLGKEELGRQREEILLDKENIHVRRTLIDAEISEITQKITALDAIRNQLEQNLLRLHEEELELDDELEGVQERYAFEEASKHASAAATTRAGRRRKGPAFLPSEHDELPPGVAFMTLSLHSAPITALDFSEPYGVLVSASQDDSTRLWDLCTGDEIGRLRGHSGTVKCMQVEDNICLTGGADSTIRIWDLHRVSQNLEPVSALDELPEIVEHSDAFDDNSSQTQGSSIRDSSDAEPSPSGCMRVFEGHSKSISALYFEDSCLVSGASDKTIRQWDVSTGQCVLTMDILWAISHPPAIHQPSSLYSSDDTLYPSGGLLNVTSGNFAVPTPPYVDGSWEMYQDFVGAVQFWGYALVSGSGDGAVRMWDMRTGQAHRTLIGHTAPVTCLQFDELHVVSGSLDKTIKIWDLRTGGISETIKYDYPVTAVQFDSRKIVSCCGENAIKIYNRTTMQHSVLATNGHTKPVERMRYIDRYLVSGGKDNVVKIWSL